MAATSLLPPPSMLIGPHLTDHDNDHDGDDADADGGSGGGVSGGFGGGGCDRGGDDGSGGDGGVGDDGGSGDGSVSGGGDDAGGGGGDSDNARGANLPESTLRTTQTQTQQSDPSPPHSLQGGFLLKPPKTSYLIDI